MASWSEVFDVVIVGAGFAGSALGAVLAARGLRISVCDPHDAHPHDFGAEKLSVDQIDALERLGLAAPALRAATPIGRLRANLFVYRLPSEDWSRGFRADPVGVLNDQLPGLRAMLPPFAVADAPSLRPIHLYAPPERIGDGVALIGDAYSTTCPAGGGGLRKALTDIERQLTFLPRWLAPPRGIGAADIASFYSDPWKRVSEANALRTGEVSRAMAIDPGLCWEARRQRNYYGLRMQSWLRRRPGARRAAASGTM